MDFELIQADENNGKKIIGMELTYKFSDLDNSKVNEAGGKNALLGAMFQKLSSKGINVPDGFATTSKAYWRYIDYNELKEFLRKQLNELDKKTTIICARSGKISEIKF